MTDEGKQREILALRARLAELEGAGAVPADGKVEVADGAVVSAAVGVNLGKIVFGRDPEVDETTRLVRYLRRLASKLSRLPLRGIEERLEAGDGLSLPAVYVSLATKSEKEVARGTVAELEEYFAEGGAGRQLSEKHDPDRALPTEALFVRDRGRSGDGDDAEPVIGLVRSLLATEAIAEHGRMVLVGDPGGGKTTFVRHLAWALARRGLDESDDGTRLAGWSSRRLLPIVLPMRQLAGRLARDGACDKTVQTALIEQIEAFGMEQVADLLCASLERGATILLFDGLDEVPTRGVDGEFTNRLTTLRAVRSFAELHSGPVIVTCRRRAFDADLERDLGWPVERLAPFTMGQVRHFVPAWYGELVRAGQMVADDAGRAERELVAVIASSAKLRAMAGTPLLVTMMALVQYNDGRLPRDRPRLYERVLDLLLSRWDKVKDGHSLGESVGLPDWESRRFLPLLDRLSYEAHRIGSSEDGRGRLAKDAVRKALIEFFERAKLDDAWRLGERCLEYFEQRSGLLVPDGNDSYVFSHLTLQEHCAGRHLVYRGDAGDAIREHRVDDRWHEPILLGLGAAQESKPELIDRVISDLVDPDELGEPKATERRQRDLLLAAELGEDRDWSYLRTQGVAVDRLQKQLIAGLVSLLRDREQTLPVAERVRAGFYLGDLGDPRYPVTLEQWREEIKRALRGETDGYFCRVESGTYRIGADEDDSGAPRELPACDYEVTSPFYVARLPVTVSQWQRWVEAGGTSSRYADDSAVCVGNQPVVGVTWHACQAFVEWLTGVSKQGWELRLPSEGEWEVVARGGDRRAYPWGAWEADCAATLEDWEVRGVNYLTVPVGCYPTGAAVCGALDLSGNVGEITSSLWTEDEDVLVIRGGSFDDSAEEARCGARFWDDGIADYHVGFRLVLSPLARAES